MRPDVCTSSLTSTVVTATGIEQIERDRPARRPAIDCFYVYATVSPELTLNARRVAAAAVRNVAIAQASRFSSVCRVYAPLSRQLTLSGLSAPAAAQRRAADLAYSDVLAAWREYLGHDNRGRGFVLIGHSQGALLLRRLMRSEVDRHPAIRRKLVSAVLLGGNVKISEGHSTGGDFRHVPACRSARQTGCVIAYSAFNSTPPPDSAESVQVRTPSSEDPSEGPWARGSKCSASIRPRSSAVAARCTLTSRVNATSGLYGGVGTLGGSRPHG